MSRNEERIDELAEKQVRLEVAVANASTAISEQKGSYEKLLDALNKLSDGVAGTKGSLRALFTVLGFLCLPVIASSALQMSTYKTLGEIDERTKGHAKAIEDMTIALGDIKKQKGADIAAVDKALETFRVQVAAVLGTAAQTASELQLPQTVLYLTLAKDFKIDTSEGDAVLSWDQKVANVPPGYHVSGAVVIHVASPLFGIDAPMTTTSFPTTNISVKVLDKSNVRISVAVDTQEDKAKIETFFREGGAMSMDIAIYLAK